MASACTVCLGWRPGSPACCIAINCRHQFDTVDRTDRNAQFTARAVLCHHGVHAFAGTHNGIHGACIQAQRATDAPVLINHGQGAGRLDAKFAIEQLGRHLHDCSNAPDALHAARRALVNACLLQRHCLRVMSAIGVPAAGALGLGQHGIHARCHTGQNQYNFRHHQQLSKPLSKTGPLKKQPGSIFQWPGVFFGTLIALAYLLIYLRVRRREVAWGNGGAAVTAARRRRFSGELDSGAGAGSAAPVEPAAGSAGISVEAAEAAEVAGIAVRCTTTEGCTAEVVTTAAVVALASAVTAASGSAAMGAITAGLAVSLSRMNWRRLGYTFSRQRRPLKMP